MHCFSIDPQILRPSDGLSLALHIRGANSGGTHYRSACKFRILGVLLGTNSDTDDGRDLLRSLLASRAAAAWSCTDDDQYGAENLPSILYLFARSGLLYMSHPIYVS